MLGRRTDLEPDGTTICLFEVLSFLCRSFPQMTSVRHETRCGLELVVSITTQVRKAVYDRIESDAVRRRRNKQIENT